MLTQAILISIHPKHSQAILGGAKKVELRKAPIRRTFTHVVIYETVPTKMIVGYFSVKSFKELRPSEAWAECGDVSGLSEREFFDYYAGNKTARVIEVGEVTCIFPGLPLIDGKSAPQSFRYLSEDQFKLVQGKRI